MRIGVHLAKKRSKFTRESKSAAKRRTFSREFKAEAVKLAKDAVKGIEDGYFFLGTGGNP